MQKRQAALLSLMPLSVLKRAEDVEKRFKADWAFVQSAWVRLSFLFRWAAAGAHAVSYAQESHRQVDETAPNVLFLDFLLAWLNGALLFVTQGERKLMHPPQSTAVACTST